MTTTITNVTTATILPNPYESLSTPLNWIVMLLLIIVLIQKELRRAFGGPRSQMWMQALNIAIVPLMLTFGLIMIMRLLDQLGLG